MCTARYSGCMFQSPCFSDPGTLTAEGGIPTQVRTTENDTVRLGGQLHLIKVTKLSRDPVKNTKSNRYVSWILDLILPGIKYERPAYLSTCPEQILWFCDFVTAILCSSLYKIIFIPDLTHTLWNALMS